MRQFLTALMKEGVFSIVVLVLLLVLIWGVAFYTKGESADWMNLPVLITMVVIGLWVALFIVQKMLAVRNALRIEKQLQMQSGGKLEGVSADKKAETEALRKKFNESLEALKKTKGGKSALYTLPWYVIIGPPGSGKTTALQESGLNFPAIQGGAKVRGIGGTRNCDWWFTEDGILLDTAGRYTTVAEDQEEWLSFLEMIRTSRKSKPINGAIVAVSVDDLFRNTQSELDQMAKDIRNRLDELSARLNAVFPVYLMFTKCDLIAGFAQFYEDFTKEERAQVWGFTMAYSLPEKQYTTIFDEQCGRMVENLRARQIELLGTERPAQKKQNIYLFPRQFELARAKMKDFVGQLFGAHAFQEAAILRGVYFTSGTQDGTPIDQLMMRMGEAMGMGGAPAGSEDRVEKKSYFIHNLFSKIMFPDKTLARSTSKVIRRRMAWRLALQLVSVALFGLVTFGAVSAFNDSRNVIAGVRDSAAAVDLEAAKSEAERLEALQKLDAVRASLVRAQERGQEGWHWGMDQSSRVFDAGAKRYMEVLTPAYVEPTRKRIEGELRGLLGKGQERTEEDWQTMAELWRVYAMISGTIEPQPALVATMLKRENRWTGTLISDDASRIEALAGHQLDFYSGLLVRAHANRVRYAWFTDSDADLMRRCREALKDDFWVRNSVDYIVRYASRNLPALTLGDIAPGHTGLLELRVEPARSPDLPYLNAFTQNAWDSTVSDLMRERSRSLHRLFRELRVDEQESVDTDEKILADMQDVFLDKHRRVWDQFMDSVHPVDAAFNSVEQARKSLFELSSRESTPLQPLIEGVWARRKISLSNTRNVAGPTDLDSKALNDALAALGEYYQAYNFFFGNTGGGRVRNYHGGEGHVSELATKTTKAGTAIPLPLGATRKPVGDLLIRVVAAGFKGLQTEAMSEINEMWRGSIVGYWAENFEGRFPFHADAEANASLARFSEFFNPAKGRFWTFHKQLEALRGLSFNGMRLFEFTLEYNDMVKRFEEVRAAMFDTAEDERVKIKFFLSLWTPSMLFAGTQFAIGEQRIDWGLRSSNDMQVELAQGTSGQVKTGARVVLKWDQNQPTLEGDNLLADEWGFFRLIQRAQNIEVKPDRQESEVTWSYDVSGAQTRLWLIGTIKRDAGVDVFTKDFFADVRLAPGVMK